MFSAHNSCWHFRLSVFIALGQTFHFIIFADAAVATPLLWLLSCDETALLRRFYASC